MKKLYKDNKAQGSAELILIMGTVLIIVLIVGSYITDISKSINGQIHEAIETGRNSILNKL
ncbi:class III signal peptide-containing protein [Methanobrevibacter filiformis]|uniref:Class III signal peptide n=1 Tax=Methanobrevibacter filiformis TaxID=55758 RepID=A0A165ZD10_9EURY|nr:class III signal peptide-containing protein [Methanobrevibacter filiformis]KZX10556.1 class III signal peptide [Methanobrevibacter filiformis]